MPRLALLRKRCSLTQARRSAFLVSIQDDLCRLFNVFAHTHAAREVVESAQGQNAQRTIGLFVKGVGHSEDGAIPSGRDHDSGALRAGFLNLFFQVHFCRVKFIGLSLVSKNVERFVNGLFVFAVGARGCVHNHSDVGILSGFMNVPHGFVLLRRSEKNA